MQALQEFPIACVDASRLAGAAWGRARQTAEHGATFVTSAPIVTHFRGYDPHSRTLVGPHPCSGPCLGPAWPEGRTFLWLDPSAQLFTGDVAVLEMEDEGLRWSAAKVIERTRDGKLWAVCEFGALPLCDLPIIAIAPVVARVVFPWAVYAPLPAEPLDGDAVAGIREISSAAVREWLQRGFPPKVSVELRHVA